MTTSDEGHSLPATTRAIEISKPGGPDVLRLVPRQVPQPAAGEILIRVRAAGINRGDIVQRQGLYPAPPGITDVPGLEVAGEIAALGEGVSGWQVGESVCALLAGGGYADYAVAPEGQCLPLPEGLSMVEGAALPETLFTCWTTLFDQGQLKAGEALLIHGGSSGIGMTAIQLGKAFGARVIVTAGSDEKCEACRVAGADAAINYRTQDFVEEARVITEGRGVDVVLDMVAGDYVGRDIQIMAPRGRHITIGVMSGKSEATIPMNLVLRNRLVITASTLRGRDLDEKRAIRDALRDQVWPLVKDGRLRAYVHASFPLAQAGAAQSALEASNHVGKIILTM
ncbi:NAD(P)H-quinone oxidoreductase [Sphingobium tyrosinilyticum]|uniref:NAD(P)H-quinone oxidoreductase n=1 Tax=Sphingobium tyrosinilyticum TaxID=2715436 RepID=A0ABV9F347_9SPHN